MPVAEARKVQELLGYLLVFRERTHHREALADLLWSGATHDQSRKYLRQALWRLQTTVRTPSAAQPLLLVEPDWIRINPDAGIWLDVSEVESAAALARGTRGVDLDSQLAHTLDGASGLYSGDLLEGWYQEWCIFERERLKARYLGLLGKLFDYAEAHGLYEDALEYGDRILRHDRAHERTHLRMMQLHLLAGDRTSALRQFHQCAEVLDRELGVRPAARTIELYERIRAGVSLPAGGFTD